MINEQEPLCARLLITADGAVVARSERVPRTLEHPTELVTAEDRANVTTLLERGAGVCRVTPSLPGWPDEAILRVEGMLDDEQPRRLLSLAACTDRGGLALEEMVSVVAHEVKNPLAGISGALEVVRHRSAAGSSEARILEAAHQRVMSLDRTLEDLLLLTRPLNLERARLDLVQVAREANVQGADSAGTEVRALLGDEAPCIVEADERLLGRAFTYLVDHALREDPRGAQVEVQRMLGGWAFSVNYQGGDLERDIEARIFDARYLTRSRRTGLNLPVAARLVAAHGGMVRLQISAHGVSLVASLPTLGASAYEAPSLAAQS